MRRSIVVLALLLAGCGAGIAHSPATPPTDEAAVVQVIDQLFSGMRGGDSSAVRAILHPDARLVSIGERQGVSEVRVESMDAFVRAVGSPRAEVWDERISPPVVQIDGDLAAAWMSYSFYVGERFSHCGVNAMQLFRHGGRWRIIQIADTRRRDDCAADVVSR